MRTPLVGIVAVSLITVCTTGCEEAIPSSVEYTLSQEVGPAGGTLAGQGGGEFDDFLLTIPPGALSESVEIEVRPVDDLPALPDGAIAIGQQFTISPAIGLNGVAEVQLPFDSELVEDYLGRSIEEVKVWVQRDSGWELAEPVDHTSWSVTIELDELIPVGAGLEAAE